MEKNTRNLTDVTLAHNNNTEVMSHRVLLATLNWVYIHIIRLKNNTKWCQLLLDLSYNGILKRSEIMIIQNCPWGHSVWRLFNGFLQYIKSNFLSDFLSIFWKSFNNLFSLIPLIQCKIYISAVQYYIVQFKGD